MNKTAAVLLILLIIAGIILTRTFVFLPPQKDSSGILLALDDYYAGIASERDLKNKINLMQTEYGLKQKYNNDKSLASFRSGYIAQLRRQGLSEDEIEKRLKEVNL